MPIAFFDLDRTLISVNSAQLWVRREYRLGHINRRQGVEGALWMGLYHLGVTRMEKAIGRAISSLEGRLESELAADTRVFWDEEIRPTLRPGGRDAIVRHKDRGDRVVLLTSSSPYMSAPAQEDLALDDVICTRFEVVGGVLTGRPLLPLCFEEGKLENARRYASARGEDLSQASFYTDSISDRAVLEAVGHPVCVAPDPRLRRLAQQRGWPVEAW